MCCPMAKGRAGRAIAHNAFVRTGITVAADARAIEFGARNHNDQPMYQSNLASLKQTNPWPSTPTEANPGAGSGVDSSNDAATRIKKANRTELMLGPDI